jgi:MFS transporter, DHA2 family, multidrug resistance protein
LTTSSDADQPVLLLSTARRYFVLVTVVVASGAYNAATFTATAILPQMQGAMAATQDEISWTVTFNILATAVFTPMTGWLVSRFGRGNVQFWSLVGFSAATLMCGLSQSLEALVFWRIVQGASGAPLLPLGQTILLDVFPRRQHGFVISMFGIANTFGPVIGPTLAGYLAEYYSWRWGYYMILPVSVAATIASRFALPREEDTKAIPLDWTGFLSLSVAIASTQLLLSRGQRLDWFESNEIMLEAFIAALAFYLFVAHSLTSKMPFLSPRLLKDRNYAIGAFLIIIFGMLNFTPMVLLPSLLQNQLGFPDGLIGYVVSWRGMGVMAGFFSAMVMTRLDVRVGMVGGFGIQIVSGIWLTTIDFNVSLLTLCTNAFMQGLAVGMIWTPIATSAFWTLDPHLRADGVAVFHLMRNIGSSFFISISVAEVVRATGANYSRMTEFVTPFNKTLSLPSVMGSWTVESLAGLAGLAREINRQAALIGYLNAFWMYTAVSAMAIPLVFMVRRPRT